MEKQMHYPVKRRQEGKKEGMKPGPGGFCFAMP